MKSIHGYLTLLFVLFFTATSNASVIMSGTRVIYPADAKEKTIQFSNPDAVPYLIQVTVNEQETNSNTESSDFIISPPLFRIEPHSGQSVRLTWAGGRRPDNRESIFYITFTQIPALSKEIGDKNKLIFTVASKVKLFFRPQSLKNIPHNIAEQLSVHKSGDSFIVKNPTGYYLTVASITTQQDQHKTIISNPAMVSPFSDSAIKSLRKQDNLSVGQRIRITTINDYGVGITTETTIK